MALTWDETTRKGQAGEVIDEGFSAQLPHWGRASVHPHIHHPGEAFLDCPGLGIKMHSLGQVSGRDTLDPAETVLLKTLEQHGIWCLEAMAAIGSPGP